MRSHGHNLMASPRKAVMMGVPVAQARSFRIGLEWCCYGLSILSVLVLSALWTDPIWSAVSVANYLWLLTLLFRTGPLVSVLILPLMISRLSNVLALVFIEYGAPIPELGMVGEPGIAASSYICYVTFFFTMIVVLFHLFARNLSNVDLTPLDRMQRRYRNWIAAGIIGMALFLVLALILNGLVAGFPLLQGVDRFVFRRTAASGITLYALGFKYPLMLLLGLVIFRLNANPLFRRSAVILALCFFLLSFLFGDKFFIQIKSLCALFAPYLFFNHQQIRGRMGTYLTIVLVAFALISGATWEIYSQGGKLSAHETSMRLSGRMVGQGELWFAETKIEEPAFKWEGDFLSKNIAALTVKPDDLPAFTLVNSIGPAFFSNRFTPPKIRHSLRNNSGYVTFTAAQDAVGMATFGWIGLLGMLTVCAILEALACTYVAFALVRRSAISAAFAAVIFMQLDITMVQASPWTMFNIYPFRWIILMLMIEIALRVLVNLPFGTSGRARRLERYRWPGVSGVDDISDVKPGRF